MELTFEKIGDWYISEFEVTSDFNLHIEKEPKGDFYLYQRTSSSGQYDIIEDFGYKKGGDNVIDLDFQALVYPKWIKIKSAVKPLVATITTDGEVNEVVYQAKDIEITSNGTTKVTADTGYTALASVNVKVNVPTEGGGSVTPTELQRNDVNFFDYDGTLLYAYTWDEAKELTELPALPVHPEYEVREWNYTLKDIKAQGCNIIVVAGERFNGNTIKEIEIEGEIYKGILHISNSSYEDENITIPITKGNFEKGSLCYIAYNSTGEWIIRVDNGTPYELYVDDVFNTIGKADIGACCYDEDGELVITNGIYIIPRGITSLGYETPHSVPRYHMAKVLSIPATIINVTDNALDNTYIEHLRMPNNIDYETYYNLAFQPVVTKSFWINGYNLDTFIIESIRGLNVVNIPNTFVSFRGFSNSFEDAHIIYMPETIQDIEQFDFAGKHACVIFNNHKIVPVLNSSSYGGRATFVVPDDLYDEWLASTNWANLEFSIKKLSEYNYLIK